MEKRARIIVTFVGKLSLSQEELPLQIPFMYEKEEPQVLYFKNVVVALEAGLELFFIFLADKGPRSSITVNCNATYIPERQDYDLYGEWTLDNPLAQEAINSYSAELKHFLPGAFIASVDNTSKIVQVAN